MQLAFAGIEHENRTTTDIGHQDPPATVNHAALRAHQNARFRLDRPPQPHHPAKHALAEARITALGRAEILLTRQLADITVARHLRQTRPEVFPVTGNALPLRLVAHFGRHLCTGHQQCGRHQGHQALQTHHGHGGTTRSISTLAPAESAT